MGVDIQTYRADNLCKKTEDPQWQILGYLVMSLDSLCQFSHSSFQ